MFLNDAVADGQSQAHALAHLLGGEERVEEAAEQMLRDAGAGVLEADEHQVAALGHRGADGEPALALHGLPAVHQQIDEHLLQFALVPQDRGEVRVQLLDQLDTLELEVILHQGDHFFQDGVDLQGHHLGGHVPGELQQSLDDLLAAGGLPDNLFHLGPFRGVRLQVLQEQIAVNQDAPQGIVDFMGHPRGQLPQGRQLFGAAQVLLQVLFVGDVPDMGLDGGLAFVGGGKRDALQVEFAAVLSDAPSSQRCGGWQARAAIASASGPPPGGTGGPQTGAATGPASARVPGNGTSPGRPG